MNFDPENIVVKLCAQGMQAEAEGKIEQASAYFKQAWNEALTDFEKFTAAHYCARNQPDPMVNLQWNLDALKHADTLNSDELKMYYPSLYLNAGKSYENLKNIDAAAKYYTLAAKSAAHLPNDGYAKMLKAGINEGLKRAGVQGYFNQFIDELVNGWCNRKELRPLSIILPAYLQNLGTIEDMDKLITALSLLSATRCLNLSDQSEVDKLIAELSCQLINT